MSAVRQVDKRRSQQAKLKDPKIKGITKLLVSFLLCVLLTPSHAAKTALCLDIIQRMPYRRRVPEVQIRQART